MNSRATRRYQGCPAAEKVVFSKSRLPTRRRRLPRSWRMPGSVTLRRSSFSPRPETSWFWPKLDAAPTASATLMTPDRVRRLGTRTAQKVPLGCQLVPGTAKRFHLAVSPLHTRVWSAHPFPGFPAVGSAKKQMRSGGDVGSNICRLIPDHLYQLETAVVGVSVVQIRPVHGNVIISTGKQSDPAKKTLGQRPRSAFVTGTGVSS